MPTCVKTDDDLLLKTEYTKTKEHEPNFLT